MLATLISRGCATLPPHSVVMFVLSEERITPRSVAPSGSEDYGISHSDMSYTRDSGESIPAYSTPRRLLSTPYRYGTASRGSYRYVEVSSRGDHRIRGYGEAMQYTPRNHASRGIHVVWWGAMASVLLHVGKSMGNPRVVAARPVPLPMIYPYPSQGYGFTRGLAVTDP